MLKMLPLFTRLRLLPLGWRGSVMLALALAGGAAPGCVARTSPRQLAASGQAVSGADYRPLRQQGVAAHRRIGTALMSRQLANARLRDLVANHFDSLTAENEMKWAATEPQPGRFSFDAGDGLVAFATEHAMRVRGHTLVWHFQLAPWVRDLPTEALREAMQRHIRALVEHWRGKIAQWDVVNEALNDGADGNAEPLRDSPFLKLGPSYLDEAFRAAHAADPEVLLFYNDYGIEAGEGDAKSDAAYRLCTRLRQAGVPIHGIGMQMHVDPRRWPRAEQIQRNAARFAALGLDVEFTELDVPVGQIRGSPDDKLRSQRAIAHDLVAACLRVERCTGITLWGASDADSWLNTPRWRDLRGRGPHDPLAFDRNLQPKPMFFGILDALAGK
jgi:endo-1,4-beta-xylanase